MRRLLEEFAATVTPEAADDDKGLFEKVKDIFG